MSSLSPSLSVFRICNFLFVQSSTPLPSLSHYSYLPTHRLKKQATSGGLQNCLPHTIPYTFIKFRTILQHSCSVLSFVTTNRTGIAQSDGRDSIPSRDSYFSLRQHPQTVSGFEPSTCPMHSGDSLTDGYRIKLIAHLRLAWRIRISTDLPPRPYKPSWPAAQTWGQNYI
jgi:hypothetical protein